MKVSRTDERGRGGHETASPKATLQVSVALMRRDKTVPQSSEASVCKNVPTSK